MLEVRVTSRFKKELKKAERQQKDMRKLRAVIDTLQAEKPLPVRNLDHTLIGNYVGHRECHISSDWLQALCSWGGGGFGTWPGTRTPNQLIKSQLLYQLS